MASSFIRAIESSIENSCEEEIIQDDRFSTLPEDIIHNIFSFLDANVIAKLSLSSKTFWQLCLSSPYLIFNSEPIHRLNKKESADPTNLLNRLISERRGQIHLFHLRWACHTDRDYSKEKARFDAWIQKATECNVEELNLKLHWVGPYNYRSKKEPFFSIEHLLGCVSLRVLELDLDGSELELPQVVLVSLQKLLLKSLKLKDECSIGEWTSRCCPSLKKLELFSIREFVRIENHIIEELRISYDCNYYSGVGVSVFADNLCELDLDLPLRSYDGYVEISAAKLQVLKFWGSTKEYACWENMKKLSRSTIIISLCSQIDENSFDGLVKLLNSVANAEVLCLPITLFEVLFIKGRMPVRFHNLKELNLNLDGRDNIFIKVIGSFLSTMPNLENLTIARSIKGNHSGDCWNTEVEALLKSNVSSYYNKMKRSRRSKCMPRVKLLKIEVIEDNDINLVEYFLKNADLFEEMTVFYPYRSSAELLTTLAGTLATASSNATISTVMEPIDIYALT